MARSNALNNVFKLRDICVCPTEPQFGAAGDGTTNDTAAVLAALQSGKIVDGGGKTYGISGSMQPSSFVGLRNAKLKQLAPGSVGIKTLHIVDKNDWFLQNVSVDCGSDQDSGNMSNNAGIWVDTSAGTSKRWWMDNVEVKNGGPMNGFAIWNSSEFTMKGCVARDFVYNLSPDPSDDVIQGYWFNVCSNFQLSACRALRLTGFLLSVASTRYSRGFAFGGCAQFGITGCLVDTADQAYDLTGSAGNEQFTIANCSAHDCGTVGFKFANSAHHGAVTGCLAADCGRHGFHVSGMSEVANPLVRDITFSNCIAWNTGSNAVWGSTRYAFYVEAQGAVDASYPRGIKFVGCESVDTQGTPTTEIAFVNTVAAIIPTASGYNADHTNEIIDCSARGWLTSFQSGFHFPICAATGDSAQSIPNNAWTSVTWNTTDLTDTSAMHSNTANTENIYIKKAGFYVVKARGRWATNATNDRRMRPLLNGTEIAGIHIVPGHASIGPENIVITPPYFMTPGDVVRIEAFQESGGALDLFRQVGFFSVEKVG